MEFFFSFFSSFAHANVNHFNNHGENDGKVDVALWYFLVKTFEKKHKADKDQETQRQHFHGRMSVNKITDFAGENNHDTNGKDNGHNHDDNLISQSDCRQDRVKRKDDIK